MSYQKQTFVSGEVFTAAELAHIEAGVAANDEKAAELAARANALAVALDDVTGWSSYDETQIGRKRASDNQNVAMADGLQSGYKMRIRNFTVTKVGDMNGGSPFAAIFWGFYSDSFTINDEHIQLAYRNASQIANEGFFEFGGSETYPKIIVFVDAKTDGGTGTKVDETFRIQFDYKIVSAETSGQENSGSSGTYTTHSFQNGNDLYPDELEDMENQIAADDTALAAAEARLSTVAASAASLLLWKTFDETYKGAKAVELTLLKGQTLAVSDISVTFADGETPTKLTFWGNTQQTFSNETAVILAETTSFEDFTVTVPGAFSYLRVKAAPSEVSKQTVSFKYKLY